MKKLLLVAFLFLGFQNIFAQTEAGITGGYLNVTADGADEGESGFYAGLYAEPTLHPFHYSNLGKL